MLRLLHLQSSECLRAAVFQKHGLWKIHHQRMRSSDELIPKLVKPLKDFAVSSTSQTDTSEKMLKEKGPKGQILKSDADAENAGQNYWNAFHRKYRGGILTFSDLVLLFRGVYAEAQYKKYSEAPGSVYTISCWGVLPIASVGLLTLVTGGALTSLASLQLSYSATLLSFLGGVAWGHDMGRSDRPPSFDRLGWTLAPPALAWFALILPLPVGFALTAAGMVASMVHDVLLTSYPQWFKSLRYILTVIALVSFIPTFFATAFRSW